MEIKCVWQLKFSKCNCSRTDLTKSFLKHIFI